MFRKIYFSCYLVVLIIINVNTNLFAQVSTGDPKAVPVTFRFDHELRDIDKGAGLNGSFNGWYGGVYPMINNTYHYWWRVTLDLIPSSYEYKFVTYTDTVKQEGITGYFGDSFNPVKAGNTYNSFITVSDPMIYYFLPVNGTTLYLDNVDISAAIAVANGSQLDLNRFIFKLDNVEIPNGASYYNPDEKLFLYKPVKSLAFGTHTAYLKVYNTEGNSAELTTTFTLATLTKDYAKNIVQLKYPDIPVSASSRDYMTPMNENIPLRSETMNKVWLKPGSVLALHHIIPNGTSDKNEREAFFKKEYFPNLADFIPGSRVFYLKGERGARKDQDVFLWIFESSSERDKYWTNEESSTSEYRMLREKVDWLYTREKFLKHAEGFDYGSSTDFVVIAPKEEEHKAWLKKDAVIGVHFIRLRPDADPERFEKFIIEEWAPLRSNATPGTKVFFLKGDRGAMKGEYVFFWVMDSKEVRDSYYPEGQDSTPLFKEHQKKWNTIYEKLSNFSNGWKDEIQTDYIVVQ